MLKEKKTGTYKDAEYMRNSEEERYLTTINLL